ncbi:copper resistance protein NlpE [Sphingobacterium lactis]|uniref:copper resistance protein NlpE n=1 Tax=Sphingobacterium lactis TaxID=797291 RepID=UPI003F69E385
MTKINTLMKYFWLFSGSIALMSFGACTSNANKQLESKDSVETTALDSQVTDTVHTSQNSLDWNGTYKGVIPCADCPGIETTVVLNPDLTFTYTGVYQERDTKVEDTGKFMWHNNGSVVHLMGKNVNMKLKVGENQLISLDQEGNPIEGPLKDHYILTKEN